MADNSSRPPTLEPEAAVEAAAEHHRAGRIPEAERLYSEVLQVEPQHPRASRNLGIILLQRRQVERALPLLALATAADPEVPQGWMAYVQALILATRFEAAEEVLRTRPIIGAAKGSLELHLRQAWGAALFAAGDLATAEMQFSRAKDLAADNADASASLGLAQLQLGRAKAAEASLARALQLAPDHIDAIVNMGSALKALGRHEDAEIHYRRALALRPGNAAALRNLGILLNEIGQNSGALAVADEALAHAKHAEGLIARGDALCGLERFAEALQSYSEAADLPDGRYEALTKVGSTYLALKRYDEALAVLDQAVALKPEEHVAYYPRATLRLMLGDFAEGWRDYEARWRSDTFMANSSAVATPQLRDRLDFGLERQDLAGRRVLLVGEQGIGDQVMFASMIADLAKLAAKITCVCDRRLVRLFAASFPGVAFQDPRTAKLSHSDFDKVVAMGSLGRLFRNRLEDFPGVPYLRPRPEVRDAWAARLGPRPKGLRVGLSWRGGGPSTRRNQRSIALSQLLPVLNLPDCEFVSLQYGDVQAEVQAANAQLNRDIRVFPADAVEDFEDLAGLIEAMNVVVSVQTSLVHLTGALGKDCLTLVPHNPEWRYGAQGSVMPWYRSVRLLRQSEPGAWDPVIQHVTESLQDRDRTPAHI